MKKLFKKIADYLFRIDTVDDYAAAREMIYHTPTVQYYIEAIV